MFCKNCGKQHADDARFCDGCGTALNLDLSGIQSEQNTVSIAPKKSKKSLVIILGIATAAVLIAVILILVLGGSKYKTPEDVAKDFVTAMYTADAELVVDCVPDFFLQKQFGFTDRKMAVAIMKGQYSQANVSSFAVISAARDYSNTDYFDYMENIQNYGADYSIIQQIKDSCIVNVNSIVDGSSRQNIVFCIQTDDGWFALDID